jgi:hypothetical protein
LFRANLRGRRGQAALLICALSSKKIVWLARLLAAETSSGVRPQRNFAFQFFDSDLVIVF